MIQPRIIKHDSADEVYLEEQCFIAEYENDPNPGGLSLARARVKPGERTRRHHLVATVERYIILQGEGLVEIGQLEPTKVGPGDIVLIPEQVDQRITNTGETDLLFLCLCTPGFQSRNYIDTEPSE